ncbi:unnamed protein product [Microthlaspi erraticum]|uniref:Aspartic peptidase DDI1-type domain-containing protein n=1 Tax=Microthlaspi erraticum TaxID=1685480 RepID=A0A6D2JJX3_9BRAS|nr:unnamed protein product [Microthlaspi erraticum]
MPTQTAKLLGITRLQPAQISIGLANHTIAKPRGVVVDVLLEIGDTKIPVDFHVMNIKGGCDTPLILGRPFLATAGAIMDLPNRRISLANVDKSFEAFWSIWDVRSKEGLGAWTQLNLNLNPLVFKG